MQFIVSGEREDKLFYKMRQPKRSRMTHRQTPTPRMSTTTSTSTTTPRPESANFFGHFLRCRSKAASSLVVYFLLLQTIPVRAAVVDKSSAYYRYQGPIVPTGSSVKPPNELIQPEDNIRMKGQTSNC